MFCHSIVRKSCSSLSLCLYLTCYYQCGVTDSSCKGSKYLPVLVILMLDLSIFCHVGTSWPIHLCALPPLSFFSGIGGSCFFLLSIPFPSGPLHCPVQGSTPYFVISVNGAPWSCAVHSLGSRTQLCT